MSRTTLPNYVVVACASVFFVAIPFAKAVPALPNINTNNNVNILNFGAVSSTTLTNTTAIQSAIDSAATTNGGCTVEIPAGTYLSGPLSLKSGVNLQVDTNATLKMLPITNWPGGTFINGSGVHDVEISGPGTIDGNAQFGTGEWWGPANGSPPSGRPNFINFDGRSQRILIQDVTLRNPPTFHLMLKGNNGNITIQGINIDTDPNSPNTDGMDLGSTNILVQNCHISDGDDNIEIGGSSAAVIDLVVTNCMFGHGHGVSAGSLLQAGVSSVTVINCIFTNTDYGIRMKSDNDRGGLVQNLFYYNISMTNIVFAPILIYSYYNSRGSPSNDGITPTVAAGTNAAPSTGTMPSWRNIVISNLTATATQPGMIWARTEWPVTNISLIRLNITSTDSGAGNSAFALYNVRGVQVVDPQIHMAGSKSFEVFNAQVTFSNSVPATNGITLDGLLVTNALAFYNSRVSLTSTNLFNANPVTLGGTILTNTGSLTISNLNVVNFALGTNSSKFVVSGTLTLNGTLNFTNAGGFGATNYLLFTHVGGLIGTPVLGTTPTVNSYSYNLDTNTIGQVKLVVTAPLPPNFGNIKVAAGSGGGSFVLSGTGGVTNGTYLVLTSTNLLLPLSQWQIAATNPFDAGGNFNFTNTPAPGSPQLFYLLQLH